MFALRTTTSLSALGLVLGIAGTSWLTALTYERAPAARPLAEVVMPGLASRTMPLASSRRPQDTSAPDAGSPATRPLRTRERASEIDLGASRTRSPAIASPPSPARPAPEPEPLVPVYMPSPRYPMSALRARREGKVVLSVTVTRHGRVADVTVGRSSGDPELDRAAEDAVRNWRFAGADDRAPRYTADLPVRFEITRPY